MAEKQRALPSWMAKKEVKVKEKTPLKSLRKTRAPRATFYCMNEAELVEAAVSFLTQSSYEDASFPLRQKVEGKANPTSRKDVDPATSEIKSKPVTSPLEEESSDCCDDLEMTYVSETDLDITEVETVPYCRNTQHPEPEGERSASAQGHCEPNNNLQADKESEQLSTAAEEDDALQLVREIFFT
ncbi:modulator of retrovirus infection homolog [Poecilia latipinna]|uniref:Modulator of retrovirus infection homolog n=1 Tax=Poecilia formosa TaxID=48698 RepID=A0A087YJB0_POEFO|nr:PREDICTED: modulator of retrovirus infection homolog [Poecilia formosa]XP_014826933.1 PREDICTED: modulator of retrovirus infection homolog [Poecilia mexicana]XP_014902554.1 PREDICTED: modulator of retrovirus infection homolog [Poecilia latipinna]